MTNLVSISPHQFDILYKLPFATAPLSLIGSSLVLLCVARHTPEKRCNVYHRLLIGLSVLDVIFSTCYSLSYVPHPEGMPPGYGFGNTATCAAQAFFVQVGSLSYAYSMCLAIYYVLVIRFNRREAWIATYVEPVMHFAIISFALISGIVNITGKYGNGGLPTCWVGTNPPLCDIYPEVVGECIRGEGWLDYAIWALILPSLIETAVILICLGWVIFVVWLRRRSHRRFIFGRQSNSGAINSGNFNSVTEESSNAFVRRSQRRGSNLRRSSSGSVTRQSFQTPMDRHAQQVITQCILYTINFLNSNAWESYQSWCIWHDECNPFKHYPLLVLNMIFFPLQGFFNFLIFIRPRYLQWRRQVLQSNELKNKSRWWCFCKAVWDPCLTTYRHSSTDRAVTPDEGPKLSSSGNNPESNEPSPSSSSPDIPDNNDKSDNDVDKQQNSLEIESA